MIRDIQSNVVIRDNNSSNNNVVDFPTENLSADQRLERFQARQDKMMILLNMIASEGADLKARVKFLEGAGRVSEEQIKSLEQLTEENRSIIDQFQRENAELQSILQSTNKGFNEFKFVEAMRKEISQMVATTNKYTEKEVSEFAVAGAIVGMAIGGVSASITVKVDASALSFISTFTSRAAMGASSGMSICNGIAGLLLGTATSEDHKNILDQAKQIWKEYIEEHPEASEEEAFQYVATPLRMEYEKMLKERFGDEAVYQPHTSSGI